MTRWKVAAASTALLGIFSAVGGLIGFIRASSVISAVIGVATCLVLLPCAWGLVKQHRRALVISAIVATLLAARFFLAYLRTPKVMPHLIVIGLSALCLVTLIPLVLTDKAQKT